MTPSREMFNIQEKWKNVFSADILTVFDSEEQNISGSEL